MMRGARQGAIEVPTGEEYLHPERVARVRATHPGEQAVEELAEFFKVLGDATRVRILRALLATEMCVQDLAAVVEISQSAVSHQLRVLRQAELVTFRRDGRLAFYRLKDAHVSLIMEQALRHVAERLPGGGAPDAAGETATATEKGDCPEEIDG